jgi:hypothetical protein
VLGSTSQPTTAGPSSGASKRKGAHGKNAPAPSLFAQTNPLSGVLPGSLFNPLMTSALGADVPQFFVEKFDVPAFLLPIYQSAGAAYDVPWQVLAAINQVETNFGNDLNVSSAGAVGWMQFMPATWKRYGLDATGSGSADPYNAADAIFAAARYLSAAGAAQNLPAAIYSYNHSTAYVQAVLLRAELLGGVPTALVNSITELADGHFPIQLHYHATYRPIQERTVVQTATSASPGVSRKGDAPSPHSVAARLTSQRSVRVPAAEIFARAHAAVVAVQDGTIVAVGHDRRLGNYIRLEDAFGNTYTYGGLASISAYYLVAKPVTVTPVQSVNAPASLPAGPVPTGAATAGNQRAGGFLAAAAQAATKAQLRENSSSASAANALLPKLNFKTAPDRSLIFAPLLDSVNIASVDKPLSKHARQVIVDRYFTAALGLHPDQLDPKSFGVGAHVLAGTILGRLAGVENGHKPHLIFEIRPAGVNQPLVNPRPFLDAWTQLETLELHRQGVKQPLFGPDVSPTDPSDALLLSQVDLERSVLSDSHIVLTVCERQAITDGTVDRRVLATLEFLAQDGLNPTVSDSPCAPPSNGSTAAQLPTTAAAGPSVTISAINGVPVLGNQGTGTTTDAAIRALLALTGEYAPAQIGSLETIPGAASAVANPADSGQVVITFSPAPEPLALATAASYTGGFRLSATRWAQLDTHLIQITEPRVPTVVSKAALPLPSGTAASRRSKTH